MRKKLTKAINFSIKNGSFSAINTCKSAKNVCVFGLGRFFKEAFDTWNFKERLGVNVLCDNNPDKWGKTFKDLPCVSPEELTKLEDLIVIPLVGNREPKSLETQLEKLGIFSYINISELFYPQ